MKNKEIEIKLLFNNKEGIVNKLKPDIKFLRKVDVFDNYYCTAKSGIKNKNNFIRIREINGNIELTYKSKGKAKDKKNIISKTELSLKISSKDLMEKILINLGLRKTSRHYNKKEYWSFNGAEIVFVEFIKPVHLKFMEIEADSETKIKKILKKISNYVSKMDEGVFSRFDKANQKNGIT